MGGNFFRVKNDQTGGGEGGVRGGFGKRPYFFTFFFEPFPYGIAIYHIVFRCMLWFLIVVLWLYHIIFSGNEWFCISCIGWFCFVLYDIAWYCME